MVKSKKLSKSSLAVIIMSLLLILSMIVGMTAAWFTDKDNGDGTGDLVFGTIEISTASAEWTVTNDSSVTYVKNLMPGDKVSYAGTVTNSGDPAYVYVKFVQTISKAPGAAEGDVALPTVSLPAGWTQLEVGGSPVANVFYVELETNGTQSAALEYVFTGENYGNEYQSAKVNVSLVFAAAQQANLADAAEAYTQAGIAALLG